MIKSISGFFLWLIAFSFIIMMTIPVPLLALDESAYTADDFSIKTALINGHETIQVNREKIKPNHLLNIILKTDGTVMLDKIFPNDKTGNNKKNSDRNTNKINTIISLDKSHNIEALTKYKITINILDKKTRTKVFSTAPITVITGKSRNNFNELNKDTNSIHVKKTYPQGLNQQKMKRKFPDLKSSIQTLFPDGHFSLIEYSAIKDTAYGITRISNVNCFASFNLDPNHLGGRRQPKILNRFPEIRGLPKEVSAIDEANGRYFFIGGVGEYYFLYVLETSTGKLLKKHKLRYLITLLEYDKFSGKLLGIARQSKTVKTFATVDISTGKILLLKDIPGLTRIPTVPPRINYKTDRFIFFGYLNEKLCPVSIDIKNGKVTVTDSYYVGTNCYRIQHFGNHQSVNSVYTIGVQACTGIAGFDKKTGMGFVAHFGSNFEDIPAVLDEIDRGIKRVGEIGLKEMELRVLGGRLSPQKSFNNVVILYTSLRYKFDVMYEGKPGDHLGKSYNIVLEGLPFTCSVY